MALRKMESFDTLKYFHLLTRAGVDEKQAHVQIEMVREVAHSGLDHLATKEDLAREGALLKEDLVRVETSLREDLLKTEIRMKDEISAVKIELKGDIARLDSKINIGKWQTIGSTFSVVILLPLVGLLYKHLGF